MNKQNIPDGVKRYQNGSIGEARTKSFLIDRFWILERSVDINGADFIVQRRLYGQSILDDKPPRFGIVQSKFSQDCNTQHVLKKDYVLDKEGMPHLEFFLILNVGNEDTQKMCLLSAEDISNNFCINDKGFYTLSTKKIVSDFLIKSKSISLDFIENSIQCAEFYKNRIFIFNELKSFEPDFNAISPEFKRNIEYIDGNIPDLFKEQKHEAYSFITEIEKLHAQLTEFVEETNPIKACIVAESFNNYYRGSIKIPEIFDSNFFYKSKRYLEQINSLKNDKILETYLLLKYQIKKEINNFLSSNLNSVKLTSNHIISIKYNQLDLSGLSVENEIVNKKDVISKDYYHYLILKEGNIKMSVNIGLHIKNQDLSANFNECCLIDVMEKIYELKYYENEK